MGEALIEAAARGRHPAHPARHLLPQRRPDRRRAPAARRVQRRFSDGDVEAWATGSRPAGARRDGPDRRGRPLGAGGAARGPALRWPRSAGAARAAARPPQRAAGREPRRARCSTAARRPSCSTADGLLGEPHERRPRDPPDRRATSRCSAGRTTSPASARPPSATSPTASAPRKPWPPPAARSPWAPNVPSARRLRRFTRCCADHSQHRAQGQGLEWPRVSVSSDFNPIVEREAGKPVVNLQEAYIMYVALTRGRRKLILAPACAEIISLNRPSQQSGSRP